MKTMPVEPQYLRASVSGRPVGVDRKSETLLGYVVAQQGPFKSDGRGEFDEQSLRTIVQLGNAARGGLKARFTHPDMSSDGLGKFLGRTRTFSMSTARDARTGKEVPAVRADLHFDKSAHETPNGDLANYVMNLAESDPDALSSSLVLRVEEEYRLNKDGTRQRDANDEPLPPLWRPVELHASDIVDTGDAVDGLLSASPSANLSAEQWAAALRFDNPVRLGEQFLDKMFEEQPRDVVESRVRAYLERYLTRRFGSPAEPLPTPRLNALAAKLARMASATAPLVPAAQPQPSKPA